MVLEAIDVTGLLADNVGNDKHNLADFVDTLFDKYDLCDPVSRKVLKDLDLSDVCRNILPGMGCLGRYTERLVTSYCHSKDTPDTYGGGSDS